MLLKIEGRESVVLCLDAETTKSRDLVQDLIFLVFVGATFDQEVGYRMTADIPAVRVSARNASLAQQAAAVHLATQLAGLRKCTISALRCRAQRPDTAVFLTGLVRAYPMTSSDHSRIRIKVVFLRYVARGRETDHGLQLPS